MTSFSVTGPWNIYHLEALQVLCLMEEEEVSASDSELIFTILMTAKREAFNKKKCNFSHALTLKCHKKNEKKNFHTSFLLKAYLKHLKKNYSDSSKFECQK